MNDSLEKIDEHVMPCVIIAAALMIAVVVFSCVALAIVYLRGFNAAPGETLVPLAIAVVSFGPMMLVPLSSIVGEKQGENATVEDYINVYRTRLLVRFAGIEGMCFANIVAYIVAQQWWSMAIVGGGLSIMLAMFPTRTKIRQFIESQTAFSV
ncbi:MAG: hypothetical protein KDA80_17435 [Planctomycetaceae bacterium]|nr:hypothetical protein [Planctomycetaceae bacterium]